MKKEKNISNKKFSFLSKLHLSSSTIYLYFIFPSMIMLLLVYMEEKLKYSEFDFTMKIIVAIAFTIWIALLLVNVLKKYTKFKIFWPLVVSIVFFIYSFALSYGDKSSYSNVFYCLAILFMEVHILYLIFYNVFYLKNKLSSVIFLCVMFVIIGYITIIFSSYGKDNNTIFNSLINIFSAIVGGGLTLGGVAWTIIHEKESRKYEEKLKIKPVIFIKDSSVTSYLSDQLSNHADVVKKSKRVTGIKNLGTLKKAKKTNGSYLVSHIYIVNSDYSYVAIRGFRINDDYHIYDIGQLINKNEEIILLDEYDFTYNKKINYVSLILQDIQNNFYEMEVNYTIHHENGKNHIEIISGIEIKESNLNLKNF